jgi:hypothetical protein
MIEEICPGSRRRSRRSSFAERLAIASGTNIVGSSNPDASRNDRIAARTRSFVRHGQT